jgi:hypothetical protein
MARRVIPHSEYRQLCQMLLGSSEDEQNRAIQNALDGLNRAYLLQGKNEYERLFQRAAHKEAARVTHEYELR